MILTKFVEFRIFLKHMTGNVLIKNSNHNWRKKSKYDIIKTQCPIIIKCLQRIKEKKKLKSKND